MADREPPTWGRFVSLGLEVAVGVVLGLLVGRWLDVRYGWPGTGAIVGAMVGLAGGLYLLIREGLRANR